MVTSFSMKNILIITLISASLNVVGQTPISKLFKLQWKVPIGVTTYRTNMIYHEGLMYIGSNGISRDSRNDAKDGVYCIDPKSGKIVHQFKTEYTGDNDVTGISIADNKLFFGTDNYTFFCYDLKSKKEIWKKALPYDVESAPAAEDFNRDGTKDIFFTVEANGFYALNGKDGSIIWHKDSVSSHNGNAKALLVDINNDGVKDIVSSMRGGINSDEIDGFKMAHYGDYHWALDGTNGKILWALESGAGIHNSPFLFEEKGQKRIALLDCYGEFQVVDLKGNLLNSSQFGYGFFTSPVVSNDHHVLIGGYSVEYRDDLMDYDSTSNRWYLSSRSNSNYVEVEGAVSATTMIADVLGKGYMQAIGVTEEGYLYISKTNGTLIHNLKIGKGAETSVFIRDIDGDGKLELLIADLDGNLYCYDTNSSGKIEYGAF